MQAFNCRAKKWEYVEPAPLTDEEIAELQDQADRDAARAKVLARTRPLTEDEVAAMLVRQQINTLTVDDQTALRMLEFYPEWNCLIGQTVDKAEYKFQHNGKLYKTIPANHTFQADWVPGVGTESIYVRIDEAHDGTKYDPIPAARGMEYVYGLYYLDSEDGKLYLCQRTGETAGGTVVLQYLPHELVGHYFVEVSN